MLLPNRRERRTDDENSAPGRQRRPALRDGLSALFPKAPGSAPDRAAAHRAAVVAAQVAAVGLGVVLLLARVSGIPAWDGIYAEDLGVFLPNALQHPWHLLIPYAGYLQLVSQSLGQAAALLPLRDAAVFFAIAGALIASACALLIFHASAGHIRSPRLRALLALAVVLLPVAPLEIIDCGVNTPWYLMMALFWAILWRPRTRAGMILAVVLAFLTVSSNALAAVFAPLLILRIIALPRWREHAVTVGFTLGVLAQVPYVFGMVGGAGNRLSVSKLSRPGQAAAFYGHRVVLPALGWHLSWVLRDAMGINPATLLVGGLLAVLFGWALITQPWPARLFVLTALITGFVFTMVATTVTWWVTILPNSPHGEPGSRYTDLPVFLLQAAAIAAVDCYLRARYPRGTWTRTDREGVPRANVRSVAAVVALTAVLAVGWVSDYRYAGNRSNATPWPATSAAWLHACRTSTTGTIYVELGPVKTPIPCANIHY